MLELKNISYSINSKSQKKILTQISMHFDPRTITVITGPNGSGKSTLASIIMGTKRPTSGKILLNNQDITNQNITARAKLGIAFSFQQPVRFKGLTVYDLINIAAGALISEDEAGAYLERVGLAPAEYLHREVNARLSGGELKRIEIATVLARQAEIMIFDEPEAGIDLWSFAGLIKVFQMLLKQGRTLIIISHQEKILKIANRIIILNNGKISAEGTPAEMLPIIQEHKP